MTAVIEMIHNYTRNGGEISFHNAPKVAIFRFSLSGSYISCDIRHGGTPIISPWSRSPLHIHSMRQFDREANDEC